MENKKRWYYLVYLFENAYKLKEMSINQSDILKM